MKRSIFLLISGIWILASGLSFAILDVNDNGLSDFWEKEYNDNELFAETFDPQEDSDSDGWTNTQEATAGTNPFGPNSPDGIIRPATEHVSAVMGEENGMPVVITPEAIKVIWPSLAGKQYTLLFSPDLAEGSSIPVGDPFTANGGEVTYNFEINHADRSFWSVAVEDIDADSDGLTNHEEHQFGSNSAVADTDGDGTSDRGEAEAGTNPINTDTDADGLDDSEDAAPSDGEINWPKPRKIDTCGLSSYRKPVQRR